MGGVIRALTTFEVKCKQFTSHYAPDPFSSDLYADCLEAANEWLAMQKTENFEKQCDEYINRVFPPTDSTEASIDPPRPSVIARFKERCSVHRT